MNRRTFLTFAAGVAVGGSVVGAARFPEGGLISERTSGENHTRTFDADNGEYHAEFQWYLIGYPRKVSHTFLIPKERYETDVERFPVRRPGKILSSSIESTFIKDITKRFENKVELLTRFYSEKKEESDKEFSTRPRSTTHKTQIDLSMPYRVARFVQSIEYRYDSKTRDISEYCQFPSETLYLGFGDCEDTTMLLSSMLANLSESDIRTGFVALPGHVATIVAIPDLENQERWEPFVEINGVEYTYIETTAKNRVYGHPDDRNPEDIVATYTPETGYQNIKTENIPEYVEKGTVNRPGHDEWTPLDGLFSRFS